MKPIEIEIYNDKGEIEKTVVQVFIPWKMTKEIIKLQKEVINEPDSETTLDKIENLIIKVFCGKITKEELDRTSIETPMTVFRDLGKRLQGQ